MSDSKVAIYPGSFDPITHGHMDIVKRASKFFDHLIVAVAIDTGDKNTMFSSEKRLEIVEKEIVGFSNVTAKVFKGLLVNFANQHSASAIVRGLRAVSDFEYEFQMSCMNNKLNPEIETLFMPASEKTHFVSSSLVKQVARLGADVSGFVSNNVKSELDKKFITN